MSPTFPGQAARTLTLGLAILVLAGCQPFEQRSAPQATIDADLEAALTIAGVLPVEEPAAVKATTTGAPAVAAAATPPTR